MGLNSVWAQFHYELRKCQNRFWLVVTVLQSSVAVTPISYLLQASRCDFWLLPWVFWHSSAQRLTLKSCKHHLWLFSMEFWYQCLFSRNFCQPHEMHCNEYVLKLLLSNFCRHWRSAEELQLIMNRWILQHNYLWNSTALERMEKIILKVSLQFRNISLDAAEKSSK